MDDVDRISWGRNAKRKGTGSRGVPHRLNDEERTLYDFARRKGFVEIGGSGWRRQRSDSPLVNTYRSWCDARGVPAIYLHKRREGSDDEVVVDLSPLRTPLSFDEAASFCLCEAPDGCIEFEAATDATSYDDEDESLGRVEGPSIPAASAAEGASFNLDALAQAYLNDPIYRLPMFAVSWVRTRAEAKMLAKQLASRLGTAEKLKGRQKDKGAPRVKPGKSRRHGGYGIG